MPLVKTSNVLLAPTKEMPVILSQRFQRNGSSFRFKMLSPISQPETLDYTTEPQTLTRKKPISIVSEHSTASIEPIKSKATEENVERSEQNAVELEYSPFKLKPTSSFNPGKLTHRHYKRLDPLTLAKYEAYSVPNSEILAKVSKSESRAKAFIAEERRIVKAKADDSKKKWSIIHSGVEDSESRRVGELNAKKARDRMRSKFQKMMSYRVIDHNI